MANGADATARDSHVFLAAVHSNRTQEAQFFLEYGAAASARGNICLKHAVHTKNINMALLLVVCGADGKVLCAPCGSFFERAKITFFYMASLVLPRSCGHKKMDIFVGRFVRIPNSSLKELVRKHNTTSFLPWSFEIG